MAGCGSCGGTLGAATYKTKSGERFCSFCGFTRAEVMRNPSWSLPAIFQRYTAKFHLNPTKAQAQKVAEWHRARGERARVIPAKRVKGGHVSLTDGKKLAPGSPKPVAVGKKEAIKEKGGYARVIQVKQGWAVYGTGSQPTIHKTKEAAEAAAKAPRPKTATPKPATAKPGWRAPERKGPFVPSTKPSAEDRALARISEEHAAARTKAPAATAPPPGMREAPGKEVVPAADEDALAEAMLAELGGTETPPAPAEPPAPTPPPPAPTSPAQTADKSDEDLLAALEAEFASSQEQGGTAQNPAFGTGGGLYLSNEYRPEADHADVCNRCGERLYDIDQGFCLSVQKMNHAGCGGRYKRTGNRSSVLTESNPQMRGAEGTAQNPGLPTPLSNEYRPEADHADVCNRCGERLYDIDQGFCLSLQGMIHGGGCGGRYRRHRNQGGTAQNPRALSWRPAPPSERAVNCCGCGSTIAVAESRVAQVGDTHVFSCSPECETRYEGTAQNPGADDPNSTRWDPICSCGHRASRHGHMAGTSGSRGCRDCPCEGWEAARNPARPPCRCGCTGRLAGPYCGCAGDSCTICGRPKQRGTAQNPPERAARKNSSWTHAEKTIGNYYVIAEWEKGDGFLLRVFDLREKKGGVLGYPVEERPYATEEALMRAFTREVKRLEAGTTPYQNPGADDGDDRRADPDMEDACPYCNGELLNTPIHGGRDMVWQCMNNGCGERFTDEELEEARTAAANPRRAKAREWRIPGMKHVWVRNWEQDQWIFLLGGEALESSHDLAPLVERCEEVPAEGVDSGLMYKTQVQPDGSLLVRGPFPWPELNPGRRTIGPRHLSWPKAQTGTSPEVIAAFRDEMEGYIQRAEAAAARGRHDIALRFTRAADRMERSAGVRFGRDLMARLGRLRSRVR